MSGILGETDYQVLCFADYLTGGELAGVLNRNGCANWTVCPVCHADDFTHVEGCTLLPSES